MQNLDVDNDYKSNLFIFYLYSILIIFCVKQINISSIIKNDIDL